MYDALHGDETIGPLPFLVIKADLINNKVKKNFFYFY